MEQELVEALAGLGDGGGGRRLLGITGSPGAGKSTLAQRLVAAAVGRADLPAPAYVPMDGFHLANVELARLGRAERKGAPDTFDAAGYVALLRRLRQETWRTVWAPAFDRSLEEPVAGAIPVEPSVTLVVTEGNYLLLDEPPWDEVAALLDETWYLEVPDEVRVPRLVERHRAFGKDERAAREWALGSDEANARRVAASRHRASRVLPPSALA